MSCGNINNLQIRPRVFFRNIELYSLEKQFFLDTCVDINNDYKYDCTTHHLFSIKQIFFRKIISPGFFYSLSLSLLVWNSYDSFLYRVLNYSATRVMFTFSLYTLTGVSGLDETGVNSTDADSLDSARLLMPLDSLPVLGETRPDSGEFKWFPEFCSFSSLRSFMLNAEKRSGSRPINGSANVNAMIFVSVSVRVLLFLTRILRPEMKHHDNIHVIKFFYKIADCIALIKVIFFFYHVISHILTFYKFLPASTFCITTLFKLFIKYGEKNECIYSCSEIKFFICTNTENICKISYLNHAENTHSFIIAHSLFLSLFFVLYILVKKNIII